jgi:hypothetical protein
MVRRNKVSMDSNIDFIDYDDEFIEDDGFIEGDVDFSKYAVKTFSFSNNTEALNTPAVQNQIVETDDAVTSLEPPISSVAPPEVNQEIKETLPGDLVDTRRLQTQPNGITPPIDGEHFEVSRTFKFRRSTIRMLNRLKAEHEFENVYLSSIADQAIRHYYEYVFKGN